MPQTKVEKRLDVINCKTLFNINKTGTSQVGAISKAQIKSKGDPLETRKFSKKSHRVPEKNRKGTL